MDNSMTYLDKTKHKITNVWWKYIYLYLLQKKKPKKHEKPVLEIMCLFYLNTAEVRPKTRPGSSASIW